jgi:hypothetical protein
MTPALECQGTTSIEQRTDDPSSLCELRRDKQRSEDRKRLGKAEVGSRKAEWGRGKGEGKKLRRSEVERLGKKWQKSAALVEDPVFLRGGKKLRVPKERSSNEVLLKRSTPSVVRPAPSNPINPINSINLINELTSGKPDPRQLTPAPGGE